MNYAEIFESVSLKKGMELVKCDPFVKVTLKFEPKLIQKQLILI